MINLEKEKKISIIIPVYNSEEFLGKCLKLIKRQSYKNMEIIVVNDGSTKNCDEKYVVNGYNGKLVQFLNNYMEQNMDMNDSTVK